MKVISKINHECLRKKYKSVTKQKEKIVILDEETYLELQISEQERYISRDCDIIETRNWTLITSGAVNASSSCKNLNIKMFPQKKACHSHNKGNGMVTSTVIVDFKYFDDKNTGYHRQMKLGKHPNQTNWKPIIPKESPSPKIDTELQKIAY